MRLNNSRIALVARSMTSGHSTSHHPLRQDCLYKHSREAKNALMHAVTSTGRSPPAVHATRQTVAACEKAAANCLSPFSAAFTGSSQYRVPNPSAASSRTLTLYKLYDTGERLLCLVHPSGPRSVLTMSDAVNKQLKKRGKRKHG